MEQAGTATVRRAVLAVTGGIAAYKACTLVRRLRDRGFEVRVAMTRSATAFVSPETFAALSANPVAIDLFDPNSVHEIRHARWARECDLFCVAPATANFVAKMALGVGDDFPSTLHLAVNCPILVAPAMEDDMFRNPAVRANLARLRERGVHLVGPDSGTLASGRCGPGRMSEPEDIVRRAVALLVSSDPRLVGRKVLVSAGPTREHLDPLRVITNLSSGRMGYAVAGEAADRGAEVVLVSGPCASMPPAGVRVESVESAAQMMRVLHEEAPNSDVIVMAAAISDWRPLKSSKQKISKSNTGELSIDLVRNPDILSSLSQLKGARTMVGFAAETADLEVRATAKLHNKGCDLIVANLVGVEGTGIGADQNTVFIADRCGGHRNFGPAPKTEVAVEIWNAVLDFEAQYLPEGT